MAKSGWSDGLAAKLREEEAELGRLKSERTAASRAGDVVPVPPPAIIDRFLQNLLEVVETDPARGREILSRFASPVVMTPEAEGPARRYRATGAFNLSFILTASSAAERRSGISGCAGVQPSFPDQRDHEVPPVWMPFDEVIGIGWE